MRHLSTVFLVLGMFIVTIWSVEYDPFPQTKPPQHTGIVDDPQPLKPDRIIDTPNARYVNTTRPCRRADLLLDYPGWMKLGKDNKTMNMWFWFFQSRKKIENTPIVLYLAGGPGWSSTQDIFNGTGPCRWPWPAKDKRTRIPVPNQWSFNDEIDMLYVDNPIPAGFSYGDLKINSTGVAVEYLYEFLQKFVKEFPEYKNRVFGIWAIDYGAHFAIALSKYIWRMNMELEKGRGRYGYSEYVPVPIRLETLGLESPHIDFVTQRETTIEFAHKNDIKQVLLEEDYRWFRDQFKYSLKDELQDCIGGKIGCKAVLHRFQSFWEDFGRRVGAGYKPYPQPFDFRNIRQGIRNGVKFNSVAGLEERLRRSTGVRWLMKKEMRQSIGITDNHVKGYDLSYKPLDPNIIADFENTHDMLKSSFKDLEWLINAGMKTLIMSGDAGLVSNCIGLKAIVDDINWEGKQRWQRLHSSALVLTHEESSKTDGLVGEVKALDNLRWIKLNDAGHNAGIYQPESVVEIFKEHILGRKIKWTKENRNAPESAIVQQAKINKGKWWDYWEIKGGEEDFKFGYQNKTTTTIP